MLHIYIYIYIYIYDISSLRVNLLTEQNMASQFPSPSDTVKAVTNFKSMWLFHVASNVSLTISAFGLRVY